MAVNNKKELMTDPNSPYYLGAGDHLGIVLTPVQLKGDNYDEWSKPVRNAFQAKKKIGFIEGKIPKPTKDALEFDDWLAMNAMLVGWIFNTIDPSLRSSISYWESVKELWDDLKERFSVGNDCGAAQDLKQEREKEKVYQFLMGLDDVVFGTVRSNILSMSPLPNINKVHAMVATEETHKSLARTRDERADTVSFAAQTTPHTKSRQTRGGDRGTCTVCGKHGHEAHACFEIVGYPDWWISGKNGRGAGRGNRGARNKVTGGGRETHAANAAQLKQTHSAPDMHTGGVADERGSFPGLSTDQWSALMNILNSHKPTSSTEKLTGKQVNNSLLLDTGASNHMTADSNSSTQNLWNNGPLVIDEYDLDVHDVRGSRNIDENNGGEQAVISSPRQQGADSVLTSPMNELAGRGQRERRPPRKLKDYICNTMSSANDPIPESHPPSQSSGVNLAMTIGNPNESIMHAAYQGELINLVENLNYDGTVALKSASREGGEHFVPLIGSSKALCNVGHVCSGPFVGSFDGAMSCDNVAGPSEGEPSQRNTMLHNGTQGGPSEEEEDITVELEDDNWLNTQLARKSLVCKVMANKSLNRAAIKSILIKAWGIPQETQITEMGVNMLLFTFEGSKVALGIIRRGPCTSNAAKVIARFGEVMEVESPMVEKKLIRTFIRVRALMNVSKPLPTGCWVPRNELPKMWIFFKYEKLQALCFNCGVIGHEQRSCKENKVMSIFNPKLPRYGPATGVPPAKSITTLLLEQKSWFTKVHRNAAEGNQGAGRKEDEESEKRRETMGPDEKETNLTTQLQKVRGGANLEKQLQGEEGLTQNKDKEITATDVYHEKSQADRPVYGQGAQTSEQAGKDTWGPTKKQIFQKIGMEIVEEDSGGSKKVMKENTSGSPETTPGVGLNKHMAQISPQWTLQKCSADLDLAQIVWRNWD
ncbi:Zinc finger, CCHC-type [Sesbania bispinosa]|nr:Zinc finger, CCHC-type [Sesbania bispinosa]